jgi:hypothetical protein
MSFIEERLSTKITLREKRGDKSRNIFSSSKTHGKKRENKNKEDFADCFATTTNIETESMNGRHSFSVLRYAP